MSSRPAFIAGAAAFVIGAAALVGAVMMASGGGGQVATQASTVGGPFTMVDQDGKPVTEQDLKGKPHVVFFGFTHCPDICPTALFELTQAFNAMGANPNVGGIFVTVDPARDTPEVMKGYLTSFSPLIRGFTGSEDQVAGMVKAYRVFRKKVPLEGADYTMDHTAVVYLMDRNGAFVAPLNMKRPPEEIAAEIRRYG